MSSPRLISLFDLLKTADELSIHDESVSSWDVDRGSEQPAVYRLDSCHRIYRFEDQLVELDADGRCLASTLSGEGVLITAELKRPVTAADVLSAMQAQPKA